MAGNHYIGHVSGYPVCFTQMSFCSFLAFCFVFAFFVSFNYLLMFSVYYQSFLTFCCFCFLLCFIELPLMFQRLGIDSWTITLTFEGNAPVTFHAASTYPESSELIEDIVDTFPDYVTPTISTVAVITKQL